MANITNIDQNNFNELINSETPVLVDFWATWCPPCRALGPILEDISQTLEGAAIAKCNTDEQGEISARYQVVNIPTMIIFKNGEEVTRLVGLKKKSEILSAIEAAK